MPKPHTMATPRTPSRSQRSGKRKRAVSANIPTTGVTLPPHLPYNSINPFSRSPSQRRQVSVAGLRDDEEDPTREIKDFPHRGIGFVATGENGEKEGDSDEEDVLDSSDLSHNLYGNYGRRNQGSRRRKPVDTDSQLDTLLRTIHQLLDEGKISRASRLYSLIIQLRPGSKDLDIRQHNVWAIGAEIILREREETSLMGDKTNTSDELARQPAMSEGQQQSNARIRVPIRWGSAANMTKLTAYFESLIQRYPYDHRFPNNISALDFRLAMFGCEIYACYAEYISHSTGIDNLLSPEIEGIMRPNSEFPTGFLGTDPNDPIYGHGDRLTPPNKKEQARSQAFGKMRAVGHRMDALINELPYSKNNHFHQLRAMAALFIADLLTPNTQVSPSQRAQLDQERQMQNHIANLSLHNIESNGGKIDRALLNVLVGTDSSELSPSPRPLYASLPIRGT